MGGLCRLFGVTKQAYYKRPVPGRGLSVAAVAEILEFCRAERSLDPGMGCRKLWTIFIGEHWHVSRRTFEDILCVNGMSLRASRRRTRTTDSTHGLPLYPNLVYSALPERPCQIWVADITYIRLRNSDGSTRFCYLSIVMDAYSRYILGYYVGRTLETVHSVIALNMALENSRRLGLDIRGLIHHSDRGVQYASEEYVNILKGNGILISMTENGNPKDNSRSERVNSTVKNELLANLTFGCVAEVVALLPSRIDYYNRRRPHMSLDNRTPEQALRFHGEIRKRWRSYRDEAIAKQKEAIETL